MTTETTVDAPVDDARDDSGEILKDRYRVVKVLGEGALGRTMLAVDLQRDGEQVAIKELLPSRMKRWKDYDLFGRECQTLRTLDHDGIPRYREDFVIEPADPTAPARLFLVQDFVEGRSLQDLLDEGIVFGEAEVRDVLEQVLEILAYLHGLNPPVIHRDIKPANLMRRPDGRVVLIDFGAVREAVTLDGVGSTIVGTFGYMPPEQYAGESRPATDLFALGASCVQLLTGRPPGELFEGVHQFRIPADLPVTLGFESVLLRLTEPEVERRYATADEVLGDLRVGFLMVPKEALTGVLPIPHEIRPAPRPYPGFHLRDAYTGMSHLGTILLGIIGTLLAVVWPVAGVMMGSPVFAWTGVAVVLATAAMASGVIRKSENEVGVYRRGHYALGEVTGRFIGSSASTGANLTYRYRVGDGFRHGCVSTADKRYKTLSPGDPIGVLYLPEEPEEHVMFAVPEDWAAKQTVGLERRLAPGEAS